MSYRDPTYVIFDGGNDMWAYGFMLGWVRNDKVAFDFKDAHDLDTMTSRAQGEEYVKKHLRARMEKSVAALVIVGESTKNLYKFIRWELELAQSLGLPIVATNLNDKRRQDDDLCPPIIRNTCVLHVAFRMAIIRKALDEWPGEFSRLSAAERAQGWRYYNDEIYRSVGL